MKFIPLLIMFSFQAATFAQSDPASLAFHGALGLLLSASSDPSIPSDMVAGKCEYQGSSCNGAKVTLIDGQSRFAEKTLTAQGEFRYSNVEQNHEYVIEISWAAHKLKERHKVMSGKLTHLKLIKK